MKTWRNWAGDQRCTPARIERPESPEQLAEVVRRAAADGLRVRAAGAGHSFTDIACTGGVMIDVSGLDR
ncbi:MAG: FAD-binding protein, partial [Solirubrobacterales bacterium]